MEWSKLKRLGSVGLVADLPEQDIPEGGFSLAENVLFRNGTTEPAAGYAENYAASIPPYYILSGIYDEKGYYLYAGPGASNWSIYSLYQGTTTDVTPSGTTMASTADNNWTGGVLHSIAVLNNGTNVPVYVTNPANKAENVTNWPVGYTCNALRTYKNYLIAIDVTKSGTRYPHLVLWSSSADPGALPATWDVTDATKDAGENSLSETSDYCVDGLALRDTFVVYKERTTVLMQYIGPPYIFRFQTLFTNSGILARNCVAEYSGFHIVLTKNDVIMHDGQSMQSIADQIVREDIFGSMNSSYSRSFVFVDHSSDTAWICIPTTGNYPDTAYLFNFKDKTWGKRTLPTSPHIASGKRVVAGATWGSMTVTWSAYTSTWGTTADLVSEIVIGSTVNKIFTVQGYTYNGTNPTVLVERTGIDLGQDGMAVCNKVRPKINAVAGTVVTIQIGSQERLTDSVSWSAAKTFTVGTQRDVWFHKRGRYFAFRVYGSNGVLWKLEGMDFELEQSGEW